jgi:hypothetical protein
MGHARNAVMNPLPAAARDRLADSVHAELAVVVSANGQNGCDCMDLADQAAQFGQLGALIHQIAAQEHHIRIAVGHRLYDLAAQPVGPSLAQMNIAHVEQPARVVTRRESLLTDVQGLIQPDFEESGSHRSAITLR